MNGKTKDLRKRETGQVGREEAQEELAAEIELIPE